MSETNNGMPDFAAGDNEPSMEDILSSIRKIIADDKTDESELQADTAQEPASTLEDTIVSEDVPAVLDELDDLSSEDFKIPEIDESESSIGDFSTSSDDESDANEILDLINVADDSSVADQEVTTDTESETDLTAEFEAETGLEPIEPVEFDESLDLVMDADASDYLTPLSEQTEEAADVFTDENAALREEIESEFGADDVTDAETAPANILDELSLDDEEESILESPSLESDDASEEESTDDIFDRFDDTDDDIEDGSDDDNTEFATLEEDNAVSTGDDQDMDLVKSLLADLMEEPDDSAEFEAVDEETETSPAEGSDSAETSNILDEILYDTMEDETAISESGEDSGLARIARSAREAAGTSVSESMDISDEDMVVLPEREIKGRLSLSTKATVTAVAAAAIATGTSEDEVSDEAEEFWSSEISESDAEIDEVAGEDVVDEEVEEVIEGEITEEETVEQELEVHSEESADEPDTLQEEDTMVRAVKKKEALVDEDTEQESGDAFASLTSVVREKADLEESGPPIGDLVQEALRPMLKEWLDKNLKGIVERAVTKEVKRISSGK